MNGIARFVLSGGLIVATAQLIAGPLADWNARRDATAVSASFGRVWAPGSVRKGGLMTGVWYEQELKRLTQNVKTEGH